MKTDDVFTIYCHKDDFDFLIQDFVTLREDSVREFELPADTVLKIKIDPQRKAGRVSTYFNDEYFGDIVIKDPLPKPDIGLH